jgi:hypothetical protein
MMCFIVKKIIFLNNIGNRGKSPKKDKILYTWLSFNSNNKVSKWLTMLMEYNENMDKILMLLVINARQLVAVGMKYMISSK